MHAQREVQKVKKCLALPRRLIGAARNRTMAKYWEGDLNGLNKKKRLYFPLYDLCCITSWLHLCGTTGGELCQVHSEQPRSRRALRNLLSLIHLKDSMRPCPPKSLSEHKQWFKRTQERSSNVHV